MTDLHIPLPTSETMNKGLTPLPWSQQIPIRMTHTTTRLLLGLGLQTPSPYGTQKVLQLSLQPRLRCRSLTRIIVVMASDIKALKRYIKTRRTLKRVVCTRVLSLHHLLCPLIHLPTPQERLILHSMLYRQSRRRYLT